MNQDISIKGLPEAISSLNEEKLIKKNVLSSIELIILRVKLFKSKIKNNEIENLSSLHSLFTSIANELKIHD